MMKKMIFSMLFLMMAVGLSSTDPHWVVSGIVTSALSSEPICGATVKVHGAGIGTITNLDGLYYLSFDYNPYLIQQSLDFSSVGYKSARATIPDDLILSIALESDLL